MNKLGNILYIDDEPQNLEGFRFIFRREYSVFTAENANEVFETIENNEIHVFISDQKMPEITGLELIAKVREQYPEIVCIILTAYADMEAVIQAVNQGGVYRYMMKPWQEPDLKIAIDTALDRYKYKKENEQLLLDIKIKNEELEKYNKDLKEIIEELRAAKEKAEESDRLKQSFLQNISHEIRTPMNGILGFADLLKLPELSNDKKLEFINIISSSGQQLLSIIENVLDIAKIEAGQISLVMKQIEMNSFISDIFKFHSFQIENPSVKMILENEYRNKDFFFTTDSVKLRQILDNILHNAIKFTDSGSIKMIVSKNESELQFKIEDTGVGIPSDELESVFKPFMQAVNYGVKSRTGTGLGLAITKSYVELLGGDISLQSEEGKGTRFLVSFPLALKNPVTKEGKKEKDQQFYFNKEYSVLIVEDDQVSCNYLKTMLHQMNLKTYVAEDSDQVFEFFKNNSEVDLVLMDIKLPGMSGLDTTIKLRKDGMNKPIIVQTSYALSSMRSEAFKAGSNDFITKPIEKRHLFDAISKQLVLRS